MIIELTPKNFFTRKHESLGQNLFSYIEKELTFGEAEKLRYEIINNQKIVEQLKKLLEVYKNLGKPTKGTPDYSQGTSDMLQKIIDDIEKILGDRKK